LTTVEEDNNEVKESLIELFNINAKDRVPDITSFMAHNASIITTKLAPLQTEENSRALAKEQTKEIKAVYGPNVSSQFRDPYDATDKIIFHECYRLDGWVGAAIDYLVQFILGEEWKTVIDVNEDFDSEETRKQALQAFNESDKLRGYKKVLDNTSKDCDILDNQKALLTQALVFGRGCLLKEIDPDTELPVKLKVLPSMDLGRVFVHNKTWETLGVEYLDFPFPESLLKAEEIFYMPIKDYHISPGSYHYGYSIIERVQHLSQLNRITNERNLKEINFRAWAGFLILEMLGSMDRETMRKLKQDIANGAGNAIMTNQNVKITPQKFETDIKGMTDERKENNLEIIRQLQVPEMLFDPNIINRATSQEIMQTWTESVLKAYRSWIGDMITKQWIYPILKTAIENETRPLLEGENVPADQQVSKDNQIKPNEKPQDEKQQQFNNPNPKQTTPPPNKTNTQDPTKPDLVLNKLDPNANPRDFLLKNKANQLGVELPDQLGPPQDSGIDFDKLINNIPRDPKTGELQLNKAAWKIRVEFVDKNLDTFGEKTTSAINLYNASIITKIKALEMIGFEDEIPAAMLEEVNNMQESQLRQQTMQQNLQNGSQVDANGNPINNQNDTSTGNVNSNQEGQGQKGVGQISQRQGKQRILNYDKQLKNLDKNKVIPRRASVDSDDSEVVSEQDPQSQIFDAILQAINKIAS